MPRESTPKSPGGSKPYAKPIPLSKAQIEQITRAVVTALTAVNAPLEQTTHSEDEDADNEDIDSTSPETLSSSSSTDSLRANLAPLEEKLSNSKEMLRKLHELLPKAIASGNHAALLKCTELIVRHESIATDTDTRIASAKEAWAAQERVRKEQEQAAKAKEAKKSKGKAPAARTEEEELQDLQEMMESAPEGSHPPLHASVPSDSNPELTALENLLNPSAQPPFAHFSTPTNLSHRFPHNRALPQGFSLSHNNAASTSHLDSSSNPFGATPLHVPTDFSPSKVQGPSKVQDAKASSPVTAAGKKKKSKKAKDSTSGTRTSTRNRTQQSYVEKDDILTDDDM